MTTKWTEGHVHVAARAWLRDNGWTLVAGEFPGGSDHELYPLNVVDPLVARDGSPDPRRHSAGELIPDIIALKGRALLIAEAKLAYCEPDAVKLARLVEDRREDLLLALNKFAVERGFRVLLPTRTLSFFPTLLFLAGAAAPPPRPGFSHMMVRGRGDAVILGALASGGLA